VNAYLGIGANLGPRERSVLGAMRRLDGVDGLTVVRSSSLYESEAEGMGEAPPFVNAVTQVHTLLSPGDLLNRVKTIERAMGRRGGHNRPREIDIDLVACGDRVVDTPGLTLPHPRFYERSFVVVPLQEIAPRFVCPRTGRSIGELAARLTGRAVLARVSGRGLYPRVAP
jgi:2-amino-4-hydroxy-6-hydroxymethyldihydropteridine diphosphokinase